MGGSKPQSKFALQVSAKQTLDFRSLAVLRIAVYSWPLLLLQLLWTLLIVSDYYPNCEILFMSLANIHTIRKSFLALRTICATSPDQPGFVLLVHHSNAYTPCSKKVVHQAHVDNLVNSQRILEILSRQMTDYVDYVKFYAIHRPGHSSGFE